MLSSNHVLNAALEGGADGLMILRVDQTCLHINRQGTELCRQLRNDCGYGSMAIPAGPKGFSLPEPIWRICDRLIESRTLFPDQPLVIAESLTCNQGCSIRVRVQWIDLSGQPQGCLLVTLENETQAARISAMLEAHYFHLTERERDVWMLKRADYTYDEIAKELFITTNTVKRHVKSIYMKRKQAQDQDE